MQQPENQILDFVTNELKKAKFTITTDKSRVEGYFKSFSRIGFSY